MRDYIERHHGEAILSELEEKINSGEIAPRFDRRNGQLKSLIACPGTGLFQSITFRRFPGDEVCAEIVMTMRVMRTYTHGGLDMVETLIQRYRANMWISMDEKIFCDCGRFRNDYGEKNEEVQLLSEYLIPYFSKEDIEREAEDILFALCTEALQKPELISFDHITRL